MNANLENRSTKLVFPVKSLAGCVFAAIVRDTRDLQLSHKDRFNYFPASPLVTFTKIFEGEIWLQSSDGNSESLSGLKRFSNHTLTGPQAAPLTSWNPDAVYAVTISFYPDAWTKLTGQNVAEIADQKTGDLPERFAAIISKCEDAGNFNQFWDEFQTRLGTLWNLQHAGAKQGRWFDNRRISDWGNNILTRAAMTGTGASLRSFQRRVKAWTGQNSTSLEFYSKIDQLHELVSHSGAEQPAAVAIDAGYSDQSHMGRAVSRATGFSPVQLNRLIEQEEAFWCYRLLQERF